MLRRFFMSNDQWKMHYVNISWWLRMKKHMLKQATWSQRSSSLKGTICTNALRNERRMMKDEEVQTHGLSIQGEHEYFVTRLLEKEELAWAKYTSVNLILRRTRLQTRSMKTTLVVQAAFKKIMQLRKYIKSYTMKGMCYVLRSETTMNSLEHVKGKCTFRENC